MYMTQRPPLAGSGALAERGNDWGRAAMRRWRTWQHAMAGLAGVTCWPRCGETFNSIRGELGWIALPQACSLNDPLGHKLPDRSVARVEINAGLFVRNSHDPRGFGIERRPFNSIEARACAPAIPDGTYAQISARQCAGLVIRPHTTSGCEGFSGGEMFVTLTFE